MLPVHAFKKAVAYLDIYRTTDDATRRVIALVRKNLTHWPASVLDVPAPVSIERQIVAALFDLSSQIITSPSITMPMAKRAQLVRVCHDALVTFPPEHMDAITSFETV